MSEKYRVLIANNNLTEISRIKKELSQKFDIISICSDGIQAYHDIVTFHPDVAVIDLILPGLDGIGIVENCKKNMEKKTLPAFIVLTSVGTSNLIDYIFRIGVQYCMMKPFHPEILVHRIEQLIRRTSAHPKKLSQQNHHDSMRPEFSLKTNDLHKEISLLVRDLGVPAHIKGYQYLKTAIVMAAEDANMLNYITKLLYPEIAKQYKTTSSSVERALRHAIDIVWTRGNQKLLSDFFGSFAYSGQERPTNSEFIAVIADRIRLECHMNVS